jgi:hypothetical protein
MRNTPGVRRRALAGCDKVYLQLSETERCALAISFGYRRPKETALAGLGISARDTLTACKRFR